MDDKAVKLIDLPTVAPRLSDVAAGAGVSRAAVALVMLGTGEGRVRVGEETARRIREVAQRLGYRPNRVARRLKGAPSGMVGVLLDTDSPEVMNDRLYALEEEAERRGCRLLIGRVRGSAAVLGGYISEFRERNMDGILCLFDLTPSRARILRSMAGVRLPLVFHGRAGMPGGRVVRVDTQSAIRLLYEHLVKRGRKRIGLALTHGGDALIGLRKRAYLSLCRDSSAEPLIWTGRAPGIGREEAAAIVDELVKRSGADAVIATDDSMAVLLVQELRCRGLRVPADVAVTGYDNLRWGRLIDPELTTIDQQHDLYARAVLDQLGIGAVPGEVKESVIEPRLVARASS